MDSFLAAAGVGWPVRCVIAKTLYHLVVICRYSSSYEPTVLRKIDLDKPTEGEFS